MGAIFPGRLLGGSRAAVCISVVAVAATVMPAHADELPVRKPGRWQLTTVAESIGMKTFETCVTPADGIVPGVGDKNCRLSKVKRLADELYVDVECRADAGTEKTSTVLTGDFSTWYRAMSKMTFDPPQQGVSHMGVTVDGKYLGPECKP
ncbi:DUF3617 family protein [Hyphomicrobium sp.]|uniref:DUF3617 domain-containing protein n=1 Tax=Hyphomicrobium sp. TaxID=82 RepID=UPI000FB083EC|nr:DUF3617 family protein [Hyphomicrobium sp.]RUP11214.1 MAG: DUF3617 family protein [Hyphomicrobium sp.]